MLFRLCITFDLKNGANIDTIHTEFKAMKKILQSIHGKYWDEYIPESDFCTVLTSFVQVVSDFLL